MTLGAGLLKKPNNLKQGDDLMKKWIWMIGLVMIFGLASVTCADSVGTMTIDELRQDLDDPDLVILDVRTGRDWKSSEFKIKGAVRADPGDYDQWVTQHAKEKRYVTYCA
jgi:predicted sulfurtransferase